MQAFNPFAQRAPLSDITNQQPPANPFTFPTSSAPKFLIPTTTQGALFTTTPSTKFFSMPATTAQQDEDDDDGSYIEGEDSPRCLGEVEEDGDQEVIMQGAA